MGLIDKVKLLFSIRKPVSDLVGEVEQVKSGWTNLGFWTTVIATLGTIVSAIAGYIPASIALMLTTSLTLVYNVIRAFENADSLGVQPLFKSTRFWVGILGIVSSALINLKTGGIDPKWVETAIGLIGAVMAGAQSVGASQPTTVTPTTLTP